jgi:hypothetical protein
MVKLLLQYIVDLNHRDNTGSTALYVAIFVCECVNYSFVRLLEKIYYNTKMVTLLLQFITDLNTGPRCVYKLRRIMEPVLATPTLLILFYLLKWMFRSAMASYCIVY